MIGETASELITREVTSWPGVDAGVGRRGEWVGARAIETEADVRDVIELLRLNYDRLAARGDLPPVAA